ncbi:MAG: hypothetical protein RL020_1816 [Pseudomonadota bacterium]|jgi:Protein of unknown function (DUF2442)
MPGAPTLEIEVSLATNKGFWLLLENEELFVPYSEFPWFKQATMEQITTVERPSANHLYWPLLDVDLSIESVRHPASFPLISKTNSSSKRNG